VEELIEIIDRQIQASKSQEEDLFNKMKGSDMPIYRYSCIKIILSLKANVRLLNEVKQDIKQREELDKQ